MSRSRKKNPYNAIAVCYATAMKSHKKMVKGVERRTEDIPNGSSYKKINERWLFPDDGRARYDEPKGYRK